ncbi:hypothetical protein GEMRC1_010466 [Eukaryota sp. GEM-RC1]
MSNVINSAAPAAVTTKPPLFSFEDRAALLQAVRMWAFQHGFVLSISHSSDSFIYLICDREFREEVNTDSGVSKKTGCSFMIYCRLKEGIWENLDTDGHHSVHNFVPNLAAHPPFRRWWIQEHQDEILSFCAAGHTPKEIVKTLRSRYPPTSDASLDITACPLLYKDVSNFRQKWKRTQQQGLSDIAALFELLANSPQWIQQSDWDSDGTLRNLFIAHEDSVALGKRYSFVLSLDCTYKTNVHSLPLLVFGTKTLQNKSLFLAFAFLSSEVERDYAWALNAYRTTFAVDVPVLLTDRDLALCNAIRSAFPESAHLLCLWHIFKNVESKAMRCFGLSEELQQFNAKKSLAYATTEDDFMSVWNEVLNLWGANHVLLNYIHREWLPRKHQWAEYSINSCVHLGERTTSRVESLHSCLKGYLKCSTGIPLEPRREQMRARGRPVGSSGRLASEFEVARPIVNQRRCGICEETGHNRRTCPNIDVE